MKADVLSGTKRGRNLTIGPCYPDTCIWVDAFLEDSANPSQGADPANMALATDFFDRYDGEQLLTSPMVLAEFIHVATHPGKHFQLSEADAKALMEEIFEQERFQLMVPVVDLHAHASLDLPLLDYSLKIDGKADLGDRSAKAGLVFRDGAMVRHGGGGGTPPLDLDEIHREAFWRSVTLSSALYDLLIAGALDGTSAQGGALQFQDALVLMFARGHSHVDFLTTDQQLVDRAGPKPYPDVRLHSLEDYLDNEMQTATGAYRN